MRERHVSICIIIVLVCIVPVSGYLPMLSKGEPWRLVYDGACAYVHLALPTLWVCIQTHSTFTGFNLENATSLLCKQLTQEGLSPW